MTSPVKVRQYHDDAEQRYRRLDAVLADSDDDPNSTHPIHTNRRNPTMSATTHPETTIEADATVPAIRITREFNASAAQVFRAHTDPELYAAWCGPHELSTAITNWDCNTGGAWSFRQTDSDGNEFDFYGSFHEIRPSEAIVQTFTFAGYPDGVALERLSFEELENGRCRLTTVSLLDSFEGRDAMIASGMETGVSEGFDKLDDQLAGAAPTAQADR